MVRVSVFLSVCVNVCFCAYRQAAGYEIKKHSVNAVFCCGIASREIAYS